MRMIRLRIKFDDIGLKVGTDDTEYPTQALDRVAVEDMLAIFRNEHKMCFKIEYDVSSGSNIHLTSLL